MSGGSQTRFVRVRISLPLPRTRGPTGRAPAPEAGGCGFDSHRVRHRAREADWEGAALTKRSRWVRFPPCVPPVAMRPKGEALHCLWSRSGFDSRHGCHRGARSIEGDVAACDAAESGSSPDELPITLRSFNGQDTRLSTWRSGFDSPSQRHRRGLGARVAERPIVNREGSGFEPRRDRHPTQVRSQAWERHRADIAGSAVRIRPYLPPLRREAWRPSEVHTLATVGSIPISATIGADTALAAWSSNRRGHPSLKREMRVRTPPGPPHARGRSATGSAPGRHPGGCGFDSRRPLHRLRTPSGDSREGVGESLGGHLWPPRT